MRPASRAASQSRSAARSATSDSDGSSTTAHAVVPAPRRPPAAEFDARGRRRGPAHVEQQPRPRQRMARRADRGHGASRATRPAGAGHARPRRAASARRLALDFDGVVNARGKVIPEQRRRFRHFDFGDHRHRRAQIGRAGAGTRRTSAGAASTTPSRRPPRDRPVAPVVRWRIRAPHRRAVSSGSPARERSWPSPHRPSFPAHRRFPGETARDRSAGRASRAACAATGRSPP